MRCTMRLCGEPLTRAATKRKGGNSSSAACYVCGKGHERYFCDACGKQVSQLKLRSHVCFAKQVDSGAATAPGGDGGVASKPAAATSRIIRPAAGRARTAAHRGDPSRRTASISSSLSVSSSDATSVVTVSDVGDCNSSGVGGMSPDSHDTGRKSRLVSGSTSGSASVSTSEWSGTAALSPVPDIGGLDEAPISDRLSDLGEENEFDAEWADLEASGLTGQAAVTGAAATLLHGVSSGSFDDSSDDDGGVATEGAGALSHRSGGSSQSDRSSETHDSGRAKRRRVADTLDSAVMADDTAQPNVPFSAAGDAAMDDAAFEGHGGEARALQPALQMPVSNPTGATLAAATTIATRQQPPLYSGAAADAGMGEEAKNHAVVDVADDEEVAAGAAAGAGGGAGGFAGRGGGRRGRGFAPMEVARGGAGGPGDDEDWACLARALDCVCGPPAQKDATNKMSSLIAQHVDTLRGRLVLFFSAFCLFYIASFLIQAYAIDSGLGSPLSPDPLLQDVGSVFRDDSGSLPSSLTDDALEDTLRTYDDSTSTGGNTNEDGTPVEPADGSVSRAGSETGTDGDGERERTPGLENTDNFGPTQDGSHTGSARAMSEVGSEMGSAAGSAGHDSADGSDGEGDDGATEHDLEARGGAAEDSGGEIVPMSAKSEGSTSVWPALIYSFLSATLLSVGTLACCIVSARRRKRRATPSFDLPTPLEASEQPGMVPPV